MPPRTPARSTRSNRFAAFAFWIVLAGFLVGSYPLILKDEPVSQTKHPATVHFSNKIVDAGHTIYVVFVTPLSGPANVRPLYLDVRPQDGETILLYEAYDEMGLEVQTFPFPDQVPESQRGLYLACCVGAAICLILALVVIVPPRPRPRPRRIQDRPR
jgi:hypothetical protein